MEAPVQQDVRSRNPGRRLFGALARSGSLVVSRRSDIATVPVRLPETVEGRRRLPVTLPASFGLWATFFIMVLLPTAFAGVYYGLIASNIYVAEAKFAVRGSVEKLPGASAGGGGIGGLMSTLTSVNNSQDAYVVSNYITSGPMVEKLDRENDFKAIFARDTIDPLARLKPNPTIEEMKRYWNKMASAAVDNVSGIITLKIEAFNAQDALRLSEAVLKESETLVNEMSVRRLSDTVKFANDEVSRAEQRLQAARLALQSFRNETGLVDPVKQTESTLMLITSLKTARIDLENELSASRRTLNEQAPSVLILTSRLKAMNDQIKGLEDLVTTRSESDKTASRALLQYDGLELERQFAEKLYLISQVALQRARQNAQRQQIYLVTFVKPGLPELALFPNRMGSVLVVLSIAFALWSILSLVSATVKDHFV